MIGGERVRAAQASERFRLSSEGTHLVEQPAGIGTGSAASVGLGQNGEPITTRGLAHFDRVPWWIFAFRQEERHQMMPHEGRHMFPFRKGQITPPKNVSSLDRAAPGMAS